MALRRPGIAAIDSNLPQNLHQVLHALKENVEIMTGVQSPTGARSQDLGSNAWQRRSVTLGMLIKLKIVTEAQALDLYNTEP